MTQDEIIRMAREAGIEANEDNGYLEWWNFAKLVAAHEREKQAEQEPAAWVDSIWMDRPDLVISHQLDISKLFARTQFTNYMPLYAAPVSIKAAVLAEREECAKVCEAEIEEGEAPWTACDYAAAIRARGEK